MTLLSISWNARVGLCVLLFIGFNSSYPCSAQRDREEPNVLPLSTAHVAVPGATTIKPFYSTVEWEGKEYDAHKGTTVLMQVIADAGTDASRRTKAWNVWVDCGTGT